MAMVATQGTNAFGNVAAEIEAKVKIWPKMERNLRRALTLQAESSELIHTLGNPGRTLSEIAETNRAHAVNQNAAIAAVNRLVGCR